MGGRPRNGGTSARLLLTALLVLKWLILIHFNHPCVWPHVGKLDLWSSGDARACWGTRGPRGRRPVGSASLPCLAPADRVCLRGRGCRCSCICGGGTLYLLGRRGARTPEEGALRAPVAPPSRRGASPLLRPTGTWVSGLAGSTLQARAFPRQMPLWREAGRGDTQLGNCSHLSWPPRA